MAKRVPVHFDRETMNFVGITLPIYDRLKLTYHWVDVDYELNKMSLWLMSTNGSNRVGTLQFISSWLSRVPKKLYADNPTVPDSTNLEHLEALWNQADTVLNMNTQASTLIPLPAGSRKAN